MEDKGLQNSREIINLCIELGILDKDNITKEKIAKLAAILGDSLRSYNADTDTILRLKADITSLEYDLSSTNVI